MKLTPYQKGDEYAIIDLFEMVFKNPLSIEWWRWRFLENPVDRPRIMLAWDRGRLASHYAVSPFRLCSDDEVCLAALSMTTMTHPDYSGQGLFPRLAETLYSDLAESGYAAVVGFPNANSHGVFIDKLDWLDIHAQHALIRDVEENLAPNQQCTAETYFAGQRACAIDKAATDVSWAWDVDVFSWRVSEKSGNEYYVTEISGEKDSFHSALAVWKQYGATGLDLVHVTARSRQAFLALLTELDQVATARGISEMSAWVTLWQPLHRWMERAGFRPAAPITYFGGRSLKADYNLPTAPSWSLSMLCSDVY